MLPARGTIVDNIVRGGEVGIIAESAASISGNDVEGAEARGIVIIGGSPVVRSNRSCGNGEKLFVADAATPDIDDSNQICADMPAG